MVMLNGNTVLGQWMAEVWPPHSHERRFPTFSLVLPLLPPARKNLILWLESPQLSHLSAESCGDQYYPQQHSLIVVMGKQCLMVQKKRMVDDVSHDSIRLCKDLRGMLQIHAAFVVVGVERPSNCHRATSAHKHRMADGAAIFPRANGAPLRLQPPFRFLQGSNGVPLQQPQHSASGGLRRATTGQGCHHRCS